MTNERYDLLMSEFDRITCKVNKLGPNAQESGLNALVSALLNGVPDAETAPKAPLKKAQPMQVKAPAVSNESVERNYVAEIKKDVEDYSLRKVAAKKFAVYCVYYLTRVAPDKVRLEKVTGEDLRKIWGIAEFKPPANSDYKKPLNNAKGDGLLERPEQNHFVLSDAGEYFVKNTLLSKASK